MDPREIQVLIKKPRDIKGSLTRIQYSRVQCDRSVDKQAQGAF